MSMVTRTTISGAAAVLALSVSGLLTAPLGAQNQDVEYAKKGRALYV